METRTVELTGKPGASLAVSTFLPRAGEIGPFGATLVVFLNGLMLPRAAWLPAINEHIAISRQSVVPLAPMLAYDRYGQGDSDFDPTDEPGTPYGHDVRTAVADLHQLLIQVARDSLDKSPEDLQLILVCNSIGCALARLYAAEHPRSVAAFVFLDSMIANTDFVSMFPDPGAPGFDPDQLPEGVSVEDIAHARKMYGKMFHPTVPNKERLDRRDLAGLLPDADKPELPTGPKGITPHLTVVGHDWDEFASQGEQLPLEVTKAVTNAYVNSAWSKYNAGLARLTGPGTRVEVKIARGCGHFVQKDDPTFVANILSHVLSFWRPRA